MGVTAAVFQLVGILRMRLIFLKVFVVSIFARILLNVLFETLKFVRVGDSHFMSRKL